MRKWQAYSVFALLCGGMGAACGASGIPATSGDSSAAAATVSAISVPSDNTANLDAVMASAVTQNYLTAASKNHKCAADANAVIQIVQTLAAALGDTNATVGAGANNGNFSITADANNATVIAVFEQDLPELQTALATLQSCVQNICGDRNMPNMPTFPCGKPGSSSFPSHSGNSNTTDANTVCGGDSHHGTTTGSTTHSTTTGSTTHSTTTGSTTTAGSTTGARPLLVRRPRARRRPVRRPRARRRPVRRPRARPRPARRLRARRPRARRRPARRPRARPRPARPPTVW